MLYLIVNKKITNSSNFQGTLQFTFKYFSVSSETYTYIS